MVFIEESSMRRVNAYIKSLYLNTFPWPTTLCFYGYRNVTRSKVTGNFLVNALHAFHRFNRRYHVKKAIFLRLSGFSHVINYSYILNISQVNLQERDIWGGLGVDGRTILEWTLKR